MTRTWSDCDNCGVSFSQEEQYCPRCHPRSGAEFICDVCGKEVDNLFKEDGIELCVSCYLGGD